MVIQQFVLAVVVGSLKHVLVSLFAGENENEDELRQHIWGLLVIVGSFFCIISDSSLYGCSMVGAIHSARFYTTGLHPL